MFTFTYQTYFLPPEFLLFALIYLTSFGTKNKQHINMPSITIDQTASGLSHVISTSPRQQIWVVWNSMANCMCGKFAWNYEADDVLITSPGPHSLTEKFIGINFSFTKRDNNLMDKISEESLYHRIFLMNRPSPIHYVKDKDGLISLKVLDQIIALWQLRGIRSRLSSLMSTKG